MEQARGATLDLAGDDGIAVRAQKASQLTWDRKKKKFVQGDGVGSDNKKLIRSESGARLPASFKSGRFEEWKAKKKLSLPKTGEAEGDVAQRAGWADGKRYRHNQVTAAKPLDPKSTTFEKKTYMLKKKAGKAGEAAEAGPGAGGAGKRRGAVGQAKSELKSAEAIRKQRQELEKVSIRATPCGLACGRADADPFHSVARKMPDQARTPRAKARAKARARDEQIFYAAQTRARLLCTCDRLLSGFITMLS